MNECLGSPYPTVGLAITASTTLQAVLQSSYMSTLKATAVLLHTVTGNPPWVDYKRGCTLPCMLSLVLLTVVQ